MSAVWNAVSDSEDEREEPVADRRPRSLSRNVLYSGRGSGRGGRAGGRGSRQGSANHHTHSNNFVGRRTIGAAAISNPTPSECDVNGTSRHNSQGTKSRPPAVTGCRGKATSVKKSNVIMQHAVTHVIPQKDKADQVKTSVKNRNLQTNTVEDIAESMKGDTDNVESKERGKTRKYPMGYKTLKELVEKSDSEILLTLCAPDNGFEMSLEKQLGRDVTAYLLIAIGKACSSSHRNNVMHLINTVTKTKDFLYIHVQQYLVSFHNCKVEDIHKESLLKLLDFLRCFQQCLPASSSGILSVILPNFKVICQKAFAGDKEMLETVESAAKEIDEENIHFLTEHSAPDIKKSSRSEMLSSQQPPENYCTVPVLPDQKDVTTYAPFLRPNVVNGKYTDPEHYLDVQFRLLREDYVRPLRDGIMKYHLQKKQGRASTRIENARVYEKVHIVDQQFHKGLMIHIAQLDMTALKHVRWETTKRFLSGSLLCLSSDDFQTMYFASVVHRDCATLKQGILLLHFESLTSDVLNFSPLTDFTIIETNAYFEAYRHNLEALHEMVSSEFPFQKYIISVDSHISAPAYLKSYMTYDMRPLYKELSAQIRESSNCMPKLVEVLDYNQWPSETELGLDSSQYDAVRSAVTKEFSVIQGPPGTGKTYIGLKIVQLLLHNASKWQPVKHCPILIVCYTNHALDQFLEGISAFTKDIVRVGGRCSNDALAEFQLRNMKSQVRQRREVPHHIFANIRHTYAEIGGYQREIRDIQKDIAKTYKSVLSERVLEKYMKKEHCYMLKFIAETANVSDDSYLLCDWLNIRFRSEEGQQKEGSEKQQVPSASSQNSTGSAVARVVDQYQTVTLANNPENPVAAGFGLGVGYEEEDEEGEEADIEVIEGMRDVDTEDFSGFLCNIESVESEGDDDIGNDQELKNSGGWQVQGGRKKLKKIIRKQLQSSAAMSSVEAERVQSIFNLSLADRWRLYRYWVEQYIKDKQEESVHVEKAIQSELKKLDEMKMEEDLYVLQNAKVVGMTTTGAAKYRQLLISINPRIIVVEEAAEILEAHIVTSLAKDTQHLILIGDHQQLRPSPNVYELAARFHLDVSLFERMVNNGMDFCQLKIQHRMRPCIASLLVPHIYPILLNHHSVSLYENVKGVCKNMFFVTHDAIEGNVTDSTSKVNQHEASFIVELCKYFLLQGYESSQITILTTYAGQMFAIRNMTKGQLFKGVRVTVVDNFQGEENDIILMSFVRSNIEGNIGFLKTSNRVCVALSRAKKGFFCIGNFDLLAEKSELWRNILLKLKEEDAIGLKLKLQCQNHPETLTEVSKASDFGNVREGGCSQPCEYRLKCGHTCAMMCHPYDQGHEKVRCSKNCERKVCESGHKCPLRCFQPCGPCKVKVSKVLPLCGHTVKVPCHVSEHEFVCTQPCDKSLPCGHMCKKTCGLPCMLDCHQNVSVSLECGHEVVKPCYLSALKENFMNDCTEPCGVQLQCGHRCSGTCGKCKQGRVHIVCTERCSRILVCGHECKSQCMRSCPPCKQGCENRCNHSKCPKPCGHPCNTCMEPCQWKCDHYQCEKLCGQLCNRPPCDKPCGKITKCGHKCIGLCGEPCPESCADCKPEIKEVFLGSEDEEDAKFVQLDDCGHVFEVGDITRWMNMEMDNEGGEIRMKNCPRCKTVIRRNLRFGNVIKSCLANIEKVKHKVFGSEQRNEVLQLLLCKKAVRLRQKSLTALVRILKLDRVLSLSDITKFENIVSVAENFYKLSENLITLRNVHVTSDSERIKVIMKNIQLFCRDTCNLIEDFIVHECLTASEQQLEEIMWELQRLRAQHTFLEYLEKHSIVNFTQRKDVDSGAVLDTEKICAQISSALCKLGPFRSAEENQFNKSFEAFTKSLGMTAVLNVSETEKKLILKAMNLSQGHWYQCPNGHVYCITECGGAMEEGKCNECGAVIGGHSHALRPDNRVASDMDGALYSAWPQANDLRNYVF